ncbi:MAG: YabP/YqfC family sporulation protein [Clostridia bacterium]
MAFLNEIARIFGVPIEEAFGEIYVVLGDDIAYIEGVKRFLSVKSDKILLQLKKSKLEIVGENLEIMELSENTASVRGKIKSVEKLSEKRK